MKRARKLIFSVTNDLTYDQRMIRICSSLTHAGFDVHLVGRKMSVSVKLNPMPYQQFRIRCVFNRGFIFYAEFNIRLFFYLLYKKADLVCAIDLDTILPVYLASFIKNIPRVYDAHELFPEMKEIVTRPRIYRFWKAIENFSVPRFTHGYTVNDLISTEFQKSYGVEYEAIRNLPVYMPLPHARKIPHPEYGRYVIYQGAVNEGRGFETLIPAMKMIKAQLLICGDGNFMDEAKRIAEKNDLTGKVIFTGWIEPVTLRQYTLSAWVGVNIIEGTGLNHRYSLANRFFDYIQFALPQVCVDYPAYREVNDKVHCALMITDINPDTIAKSINRLLEDETLYEQLRNNCLMARDFLNWSSEEKRLAVFYNNIFRDIG